MRLLAWGRGGRAAGPGYGVILANGVTAARGHDEVEDGSVADSSAGDGDAPDEAVGESGTGSEPDDAGTPPRRLELDVDLVPDQTEDDTDAGWGERDGSRDPAALLRRYLDETPPHHGD
jgi:hypothetical protein